MSARFEEEHRLLVERPSARSYVLVGNVDTLSVVSWPLLEIVLCYRLALSHLCVVGYAKSRPGPDKKHVAMSDRFGRWM